MLVTAFFTNIGVPATGLSPTLRIRDLSDNSLVVTDAAMIEVGDGHYKYDFVGYDQSKDYSMRCDGGATLPNGERYTWGTVENTGLILDVKDQTEKMQFDGLNIRARVDDKGVLNDPSAAFIDSVLTAAHGAGNWTTSDEAGVALESTSQEIITILDGIKGDGWTTETLLRIFGLINSVISYVDIGPGIGTEILYGRVTSVETGFPLEGIWVRMFEEDTLTVVASVRTNVNGYWQMFPDPGTYIFEFSGEGFDKTQVKKTVPDNGGVPIDWDALPEV